MFNIAKIVFRVVHMLAGTVLAGIIIQNYYFEAYNSLQNNAELRQMYYLSWIALVVSGVANIFFIKGKKKLRREHKVWIHLFEPKFLLALMFTPLLTLFLSNFVTNDKDRIDVLRVKARFYTVILIYVYSTFIKHVREDICNNFQEEPAKQVQTKYKEVEKTRSRGRQRKIETARAIGRDMSNVTEAPSEAEQSEYGESSKGDNKKNT